MVEFKDKETWLKARKQDITGTAVSILFKLNPYSNIKKLYEEKILGQKTFFDSPAFLAGRILEDAILNVLLEVYKIPFSRYNGLAYYRNEEHRLGATPDAHVKSKPKELIECKSFKSTMLDSWEKEPPVYYLSQVHAQLTVVPDATLCYLIGLSKNMDFKVNTVLYRVKADKEISDMILKTVKRFWDDPVAFDVNESDSNRIRELMGKSWQRIIK